MSAPETMDPTVLERPPDGYLAETRRPVYALLLTLPFLAVYEIGILVAGYSGGTEINGGDWLIRMLFRNWATLHGATVSVLLMAVMFLVYSARSGMSWKWNKSAYSLALLESFGWALALVIVAGLVGRMLFSAGHFPASAGRGNLFRFEIPGLGFLQKTALFCGAGVFEEFVFRVLLLLPPAWFIAYSDRVSKRRAFITSAILAALVFSAFHYRVFTGSGDDFAFSSFVFRFLAGLYFTALCYGRNFGIAVATHAFYDIIVGL